MSYDIPDDGIVPLIIALRRLGQHVQERSHVPLTGLPDLVMHASMAPREWRSWCAGRGYELDARDPLQAWFRDAAGEVFLITASPRLSGPALASWTAGISGWAAELLEGGRMTDGAPVSHPTRCAA